VGLPETKQPWRLHFRRRHPAPPFTLDFYCAAARLAVEVDGAQHSSEAQARRDVLRDRILAERGFVTLRVAAVDVMNELEGVLVCIEQMARQRVRPETPSVGSADISPASGRET
jgi:very-short-patch-repair endonuclease